MTSHARRAIVRVAVLTWGVLAAEPAALSPPPPSQNTPRQNARFSRQWKAMLGCMKDEVPHRLAGLPRKPFTREALRQATQDALAARSSDAKAARS